MKGNRKSAGGLLGIPIHIIGEFIDDANERNLQGAETKEKPKKQARKKPKVGKKTRR